MIIQQESTSWDSTKMCATCLSWLQCRYIGVKKAHLTALTTQDSLYAEGTDHRVWVSLELREPGMQGACFCPKCLSMPRVMTPITLVFWGWGPWFWIGAFLYLGFMDYDDYGPTAFWWLKQDKVMVHQLLRGVDKSGAMSTRLHVPVSLWWKNMKRSNCCCMFARHGRLGLGNHRNDDSLCFFLFIYFKFSLWKRNPSGERVLRAQVVPYRSALFDNSNVYYSYKTCGSSNQWLAKVLVCEAIHFDDECKPLWRSIHVMPSPAVAKVQWVDNNIEWGIQNPRLGHRDAGCYTDVFMEYQSTYRGRVTWSKITSTSWHPDV